MLLPLHHFLLSISLYCVVSSAMHRPKILITHSDVPIEAIQLLQETCDLIINTELPYPSEEEVIAKVHGVDAIFWSSKLKLNERIIDAAGAQLKAVGTMSAGYDNIDVGLLRARNIKLGNTPKVLDDTVANSAILLALAAAKRIQEGRQTILDGTWSFGPQWFLGKDIANATIGIVGLGSIGETIARRLRAFDVGRILYSGHREKPASKLLNAEFVTFDRLLAESDYVFVTCPLTNETRGMFNKAAFATMRSDSIFINIARGEIVVQDDLIDALQNNRIYAAGLDVMTPEPLPPNHPLLSLPNCIITPHLGSATYATRRAMALLTATNLLNFFAGKQMAAVVV